MQDEEQVEDLGTGGGVEVSRGFVGEQQTGVADECPGDGDALLLAAGQPGRQVVLAARQADGGEQAACLGPLVVAGAERQHRGGHVVAGGQRGEQMEPLEHETDPAPVEGALLVAHRAQVVAVDGERAAVGGVHRAGQVQQGGFARAGSPGERHRLPGLDVQRDLAQRSDRQPRAGPVCLAHRAEANLRARHDQPPRRCPQPAFPHYIVTR